MTEVLLDDDVLSPRDAAQVASLDAVRAGLVADESSSARLARLIDLRDVRCCGPGCSSSRCDRDHLDPHPAGPTNAANLGLASPRCHSAKHHGWTLVRHPDGSVTWTSPLHRTYDRPGPWNPPPKVDLRAAPPPPRPRKQRGAAEDDDTPLLDALTPPEPDPPPPTRTTWDDPPF